MCGSNGREEAHRMRKSPSRRSRLPRKSSLKIPLNFRSNPVNCQKNGTVFYIELYCYDSTVFVCNLGGGGDLIAPAVGKRDLTS